MGIDRRSWKTKQTSLRGHQKVLTVLTDARMTLRF